MYVGAEFFNTTALPIIPKGYGWAFSTMLLGIA